jgi:DNA modification methylase
MKVIDVHHGENFSAYHADCVEGVRELPDASVGFSIYSPPFSHLFIYSDSERDMGNAANDAEFLEHYGFLLRELHRVTKPGRLTAVHCTDMPRTKAVHGEMGLWDMPGAIIEAHKAAGWTYHSRVTIWKDPVVEMQRTKAHGLLYKTFCKDSSRVRQGLPDYLLIFRKTPADEKEADHVGKDKRLFPVSTWQQWASPVWMDIDQTNVLNARPEKDPKDEKHLCPLQLDLIERAIRLWSNEGDTVLSPFMGIGSEGWGALKCRRRFVGFELHPKYFPQAVKNLTHMSDTAFGGDLLDVVA